MNCDSIVMKMAVEGNVERQRDDAHDEFQGRFLFKHPCSPAAQTGWKMDKQESVALENGIVDQTSPLALVNARTRAGQEGVDGHSQTGR